MNRYLYFGHSLDCLLTRLFSEDRQPGSPPTEIADHLCRKWFMHRSNLVLRMPYLMSLIRSIKHHWILSELIVKYKQASPQKPSWRSLIIHNVSPCPISMPWWPWAFLPFRTRLAQSRWDFEDALGSVLTKAVTSQLPLLQTGQHPSLQIRLQAVPALHWYQHQQREENFMMLW